MATEYQSVVLSLTVGLFDAAPGVGYLSKFNQRLVEGETREELATYFTQTGAFQKLYSDSLSNSAFAEKFITSLVGASVEEVSKNWAVQWLENQLNGGASKAEVMLVAIDNLQRVDFSDSSWGNASRLFANKVTAAAQHSILEKVASDSLTKLQAPLKTITSDVDVSTGEKVFSLDFDNRSVGEYLQSDYAQDFGTAGKLDHSHAENDSTVGHQVVEQGLGDNALRVTLPEGDRKTGLQSYIELEENHEALSLRYEVAFEDGFDWSVHGGKLLGLSGVASDSSNATGGRNPLIGQYGDDFYEGFSARSMFRENGEFEQYRYDLEAAGKSDLFRLGDNIFSFQSGKTYVIEQHIVMNTPGIANGTILTWINGQLVGAANDYQLRASYDYGINKLLVDIWTGGSNDNFNPKTTSYVTVDDIVVQTLPEYDAFLNSEPDIVLTSSITPIIDAPLDIDSFVDVSEQVSEQVMDPSLLGNHEVTQNNNIEIIGLTTDNPDALLF